MFIGFPHSFPLPSFPHSFPLPSVIADNYCIRRAKLTFASATQVCMLRDCLYCIFDFLFFFLFFFFELFFSQIQLHRIIFKLIVASIAKIICKTARFVQAYVKGVFAIHSSINNTCLFSCATIVYIILFTSRTRVQCRKRGRT